ncbi:hypothetical protein ZTR_05945 [Talaromyces verruculosus]|nr:hypothetical protein ZTR_05945 [Talaromyces verruculosus]
MAVPAPRQQLQIAHDQGDASKSLGPAIGVANSRPLEATSLPAANRDIQRLRSKVKDLQEQLRIAKQEATEARIQQAQIQTPAQTNFSTPSLHSLPDAVNDLTGNLKQNSNPALGESWQGLRDIGTGMGELYYGPMSSSYFLARVNRYLSSDTLNQPLGDLRLKPYLADIDYEPAQHQQPQSDTTDYAEDLTRVQEEYYLNLLWQTYHCLYPILSEPDFAQYYDSLWPSSDGNSTRKPSPLVDILLAACMQFGNVFLFGEHNRGQDSHDVDRPKKNIHMAGHTYYQRAHRLLQNELEYPSITTLQAHIYSVIYLYNLSQFNAAHTNLGTTVRIAQALRLHLPPVEGTSPEDQGLYHRIWNTIYRLDSQLSTNLGRPPLVQHLEFDDDNADQARLSGTSLLSSHEDISWLSFHVQCTKLISVVQDAQAAFEQKCGQLLDGNTTGDIYDNPRTTETLAEFFGRKTTPVREWVHAVPKSLKCGRRADGEAFSTDRTPLNLDTYIPLWLQRQRLFLELLYHHLQISISRQFLRFPPVAVSLTPLADNLGISCVYHAITLTNIIHQVLSETDLLHGWFHVYQYQWDAVLCTLGFVLANPVCPPTPPARKSLQTAVQNLEIIGEHFPAAASAASLVRDVNERMDQVIDEFRRSITGRQGRTPNTSSSSQTSAAPLSKMATNTPSTQYLSGTSTVSWPDQLMPALDIVSTPPLMTTNTGIPAVSMPIDVISGNDLQWVQGTLDSWVDFADPRFVS